MHGMMENEGPELSILQEIKDLMDQRLGDKLKPKVEVSSVSMMKPEEEEAGEGMESPMEEKSEPGELSPDDMQKLEEIRAKLMR